MSVHWVPFVLCGAVLVAGLVAHPLGPSSLGFAAGVLALAARSRRSRAGTGAGCSPAWPCSSLGAGGAAVLAAGFALSGRGDPGDLVMYAVGLTLALTAAALAVGAMDRIEELARPASATGSPATSTTASGIT
ncbi:hypothetical protein ACQP00_27585 [Dactylosporangium sp. CS-047395]|uniref:hypothetical protein n=1 Tax=Dactylosporangium sp. CS-047395 TaxID=3239936 RepID=UPI003D8E8B17